MDKHDKKMSPKEWESLSISLQRALVEHPDNEAYVEANLESRRHCVERDIELNQVRMRNKKRRVAK